MTKEALEFIKRIEEETELLSKQLNGLSDGQLEMVSAHSPEGDSIHFMIAGIRFKRLAPVIGIIIAGGEILKIIKSAD
jgi:hypothetical protein